MFTAISLLLLCPLKAETFGYFEPIGDFNGYLTYGHVHYSLNFSLARTSLQEYHQELYTCCVGPLRQSLKNVSSKYKNDYKTYEKQWKQDIANMESKLDRIEGYFKPAKTQKRNIFAATMGLFGIGLGLFDAVEISHLSNQVSGIKGDFDKIVHELEQNELAISLNSEAIKDLSILTFGFQSQLTELQWRKTMDKTDKYVQKKSAIIKSYLREMERTAEKALVHKFNPSSIRLDMLNSVYSRISLEVSKRNLKFAQEGGIRSLFDCSVSYHVLPNLDVRLFIHIPLTRMSKLKLFKFHAVPFLLSNHSLAILGPQPSFLAIDGSSGFHRTLSAEEYQNCKHIDSSYYCFTGPFKTYNNLKATCLGSLFGGSSSSTCQVKFRKNSDFEVLLPNKVVINRVEPEQVFKTCPNLSLSFRHANYVEYNLTRGCSLNLGQLTINSPSNGLEWDLGIELIQPHIVPHLESIDLEEIDNILKCQNNDRSLHLNLPELDISELRSKHRAMLSHHSSGISMVLIVCLITIGMLVGIGVSIMFIYRHLSKKKRDKSDKEISRE